MAQSAWNLCQEASHLSIQAEKHLSHIHNLGASHKVLGQSPGVVEAHNLGLYGQSLRPMVQDGLAID